MSNTKTTKRALLTSVMALLLCFAMLTGTTFAWFTDTETSSGNKIVAGNLDVELRLWDGTSDATVAFENAYTDIGSSSAPIFGSADKALNSLSTLWEPGKTQVAYLAIANAGNLELKYMVNLDTRNPIDGKNLYEAMSYVIVPDASYGSEIVWADIKDGALSVTPGIFAVSPSTNLSVDGVHYFALVIHMDENAGNQYQGGQVEFDINVLATQLNAEEDAFGKDYDEKSEFDGFGYGVAAVDNTMGANDLYEIPVKDSLKTTPNSTTQLGHATIPTTAVDPEASEIKVTIEKQADVYDGVTVESDQGAVTYEITVEGLKEGNTEEVEISLRIGAGYSGVKVYHEGELLSGVYYNGTDVVFKSANFSPFTVVYDAEYVAPEDPTPENLPKASVTEKEQYVGFDEFGSFGGFAPTEGYEAKLDAAYEFSITESATEAAEGPYANWLCDFYVSLSCDLGANEIFLAGQYEGFPWIGFHNGDYTVEAGDEIALLGFAIGGATGLTNWTYADIANKVGTFLCGVGNVGDSLSGETFTVALRLINPDNTAEYYDVAVVEYTFE